MYMKMNPEEASESPGTSDASRPAGRRDRPRIGRLLISAVGGAALVGVCLRQRQLIKLLSEKNNALDEVNKTSADFVAMVSHDIRAHLARIQLQITGALDFDADWSKDEIAGILRATSVEVDSLTAEVRNLLDMSRLDAGMMPLQTAPTDLTDTVGTAIERLQPILQSHPLEVDFPPEPLMISGDHDQILRVVINLLENAVKYSPDASAIHLQGRIESERVILMIRDEGRGIEPGHEEKVFGKYHRAPNSLGRSGVGLGLAICKRIVDSHGGTIGVFNDMERGAVFWVEFPHLNLFVEE